jgi:hypothetical protein
LIWRWRYDVDDDVRSLCRWLASLRAVRAVWLWLTDDVNRPGVALDLRRSSPRGRVTRKLIAEAIRTQRRENKVFIYRRYSRDSVVDGRERRVEARRLADLERLAAAEARPKPRLRFSRP